MKARVLEEIGVYTGWNGAVSPGGYDEVVRRLAVAKQNFLARESANEQERAMCEKVWPFEDPVKGPTFLSTENDVKARTAQVCARINLVTDAKIFPRLFESDTLCCKGARVLNRSLAPLLRRYSFILFFGIRACCLTVTGTNKRQM